MEASKLNSLVLQNTSDLESTRENSSIYDSPKILNTSIFQDFHEELDIEALSNSLSSESKKIRKKRRAYDRIDDERRSKLVEAVEKGETLKYAAKKLGINYSSGKSIVKTYRKEGRIARKRIGSNQNQIHQSQLKNNYPLSNLPRARFENNDMNQIKDLTATFENLSLGCEVLENIAAQKPKIPSFKPHIIPSESDIENIESRIRIQLAALEAIFQCSSCLDIPALMPPINMQLTEPEEAPSDYFYMNYSDSPLSDKTSNELYHDDNKRTKHIEFDSFNEMVQSLNRTISQNSLITSISRQNSIEYQFMGDCFRQQVP